MSNVFQNLQLQRIADEIANGMAGGGSLTLDVTGAGDMQPATASAAGAHGLVPAPQAGDENKVLSGAGVWVAVGGGGGLDYSTVEQNTGVKWIDGKDIFFITFDITGAQYASPNYVTIATVPNIDLLIHAQCVVYEGADGTVVPDINQRLRVVSGGDIKIYTETSWNLTRGSHLTVWYTKI